MLPDYMKCVICGKEMTKDDWMIYHDENAFHAKHLDLQDTIYVQARKDAIESKSKNLKYYTKADEKNLGMYDLIEYTKKSVKGNEEKTEPVKKQNNYLKEPLDVTTLNQRTILN